MRLYERAHRAVFTFVMRITANRETAEEVTLDVFHDVWRRASRYQEADGTVLGWIMNQARSRAIDRLRFEQRKKRVQPEDADPLSADRHTHGSSRRSHRSSSSRARRFAARWPSSRRTSAGRSRRRSSPN